METKRSTFATSFYIKRSALRNRDGKATIMVKIFVDGDDKSMGTKLFVTPDLWENGKAKVISSMLTISIVPIRFYCYTSLQIYRSVYVRVSKPYRLSSFCFTFVALSRSGR